MIHAIIVGGDRNANFIVKAFAKNHIPFVVVNEDPEVAKYLSQENHIDVFCSATNKLHTYQELDVKNYDLVVALEQDDIKNYIIVSLLKKHCKVKKAICTVNDPDNVSIFRDLGVDTPISSSYLLAQRIMNDSDIASVMKTLSLENDNIVITEVTIQKEYLVAGKQIKDIAFPEPANISCIYRSPNVIIPRGDTVLMVGDNLIICSTAKSQKAIIDFIKAE
ncbi:MAG: NAD-binding protein [Bacilli bacterium]|nr:NAD-binding protein [Bacilli bacterium]